MNPWLHEQLAGKWDNHNSPKEPFSDRVVRDPKAYVGQIIAGLTHAERRVQNGCAELASLLSEPHPKLLYKHLDTFVNKLDAPEAVLRWEAVCTLGNLAQADDNATLLRHVPAIARHLNDKSIVLQGHAARALAKVAQRFPEQSDGIFGCTVGRERQIQRQSNWLSRGRDDSICQPSKTPRPCARFRATTRVESDSLSCQKGSTSAPGSGRDRRWRGQGCRLTKEEKTGQKT